MRKLRKGEKIAHLVNLYQIILDPFWQKKTGKLLDFAILTIFGQNWGQMLSDLNSETRFGILSLFHNFLTPICKDLHILIF